MKSLNLVIRPFTSEDYNRVVNLWEAANIPYRPKGRDSLQKINEQINRGNSLFLVAESDGKIIGTVLGTYDGRKGWINRLAVDAKFRRWNVARRLVKEVEGKFEQMGLEVIACLIEAENKVAMAFFKGLGYEEWSGKYFSKRKSRES